MRVSQQTKRATIKRIRDAARRLFLQHGFESTTTRDIATAAGIANGTLFNYYPSKEVLAMSFIEDAMGASAEAFLANQRGDESLVEDLFAFILANLRELQPYRGFVTAVLETTMSPFAQGSTPSEAARLGHLEHVDQLLAQHGYMHVPKFVFVNMYWSLFTGMLSFWSRDASERQQETLALVDYATRLFVQTMAGTAPKKGALS